MDINVTINVDATKSTPKVEVKKKINPVVKKPLPRRNTGGIIEFPQRNGNAVLNMLGIKET